MEDRVIGLVGCSADHEVARILTPAVRFIFSAPVSSGLGTVPGCSNSAGAFFMLPQTHVRAKGYRAGVLLSAVRVRPSHP